MTDDPVLIERLHALRGTSLTLTVLTDDITLDYQIARVHQRHSEHQQHVVLKLVALLRLAQLAQTDMCAWETQVTRLWSAKALELITNSAHARGHSIIGPMVNFGGHDALDRLCDMLLTADESSETDVDPVVAIPVHLNLLFMGNRVSRAIALHRLRR